MSHPARVSLSGAKATSQLAPRVLTLPSWDQILVLLALSFAGGLVALTPTIPHDFWWHLKTGQIVAEQGIPTTNRFAWTLPADQPYTYAAWLAEWLMYQLYRLGGPAFPVLVRNLLGLAAFGLVGLEARRRSGSWRLAALAVMFATVLAADNFSTRPQNFSWPLFALFALLLSAYASGRLRPRALLALPALMALWVNLHGAFVLGLALTALVCAGETLRHILRRPGALDRRRLVALGSVAAATAVAALLNPLGLGIVRYVAGVAGDPAVQSLATEWQPPTPQTIPGLVFFASLLALPLAWLLSRRRPTLTDALLAGVFAILAARSQRDVIWYGMLTAPLLAQCLAAPLANRVARASSSVPAQKVDGPRRGRATIRGGKPNTAATSALPAPRRDGIVRAALALLLLAGLVAVQPPFSVRVPIEGRRPEDYAAVPNAPRLFSYDTPVAATEYLRAHPGSGRLFNYMGYGSYLIWAFGDTTSVFADPRIELYPLAFWHDYLAISGARTVNPLLIDKYQVDRVLLSQLKQPQLAAAMAADSEHWALEYRDAAAAIYRRR
jgi:hypothetical protein